MTHVIEIGKDEYLAHIGSHSNNILGILSCKIPDIVNGEIGFGKNFLIVRQLNDKTNSKDARKPSPCIRLKREQKESVLGKCEGEDMTNVHRFT